VEIPFDAAERHYALIGRTPINGQKLVMFEDQSRHLKHVDKCLGQRVECELHFRKDCVALAIIFTLMLAKLTRQ
jgi:hypothetical protein